MSRAEDQAQAVLDAAQRHHSPSAAVQARTWSAIQSRWAAGDQGPPLGADPSASLSTATLSTGTTKGWLVVLGVVVLGAAGIGAAVVSMDEPPAPAPVVAAAEGPAPASSEATALPPPHAKTPARARLEADPSPPPAALEPSPRPRAPSAARTPARRPSRPNKGEPSARDSASKESPPAAEGPALGDEVALLGQARQALGRGAHAEALTLLDRHRKRFPRGKLMQERELSRVTALCELGRVDEARTAARRFLKQHPSQALRRRLQGRCVGELD